MEDIKRAFFSNEYDTAYELITQHPFLFLKANYKFADDYTGRPAYIAKNLLRGFIQNLDDYRKYLLVGYKCFIVNEETKQYEYPSYWIVNSNDDLKTILGSIYNDFDFIPVESSERSNFFKKLQKTKDDTNETFIGESYLH
jgi:hypothetical protein